MTYEAGPGEVSAVLHPARDVEEIAYRSGSVARFVAPGSVTDGRFGLFEWRMPAHGPGPAPHFHRTFSESFYVIAGTVTLHDGRDWVPAGPGDFLHVPEGGLHAFRNDGDEPAFMLILFAPGGPREAYFRELAEIAASRRRLSAEERTAMLARHDQYMAD